ncbi:MAG: DUF3035 domain-containing protein [Rhodospirillaceae bacterium]|jgi:hypothetical protein|nr:DUF3035 domain-containing protein [Rhodospirillaceae bacterium]MBT5191577.1 DUF3035 domain-containing protein [Rhodospirillaceae bacterium]MBT5894584.1 DUF3035 domain-containing protein [Rhodospirillaceae bacterium]MBT6427140.1 DUF3035 domain-containing protein [Rhodospirillaceae bacterium]
MIQFDFRLAVAAAVVLGLSACDTFKEQVGMTKKAPDEFTVITKAPLVMPPDFSLRPPRPGAKGPLEVQPREQARTALLSAGKAGQANDDGQARTGQNAPSGTVGGNPSKRAAGGELQLLQKAGAASADPNIRQIVNRETSVLAQKDSSFTDRLIFWQQKQPFGSTVDAGKEAKRLREAAAAGKSPDKGQTPIIKRRKRGWLEDIF